MKRQTKQDKRALSRKNWIFAFLLLPTFIT